MALHRRVAACAAFLGCLFIGPACDSGPAEGIEVVRYTGPPITPDLSTGPGRWVATVDTVWRQVRLDETDAEGRVRQRLVLIDIEGQLPAFEGYSFQPETEYSAGIRWGRIEIQHFDLEGEISGRFEGRLSYPRAARVGGTFWIDLSGEKEQAGGLISSKHVQPSIP